MMKRLMMLITVGAVLLAALLTFPVVCSFSVLLQHGTYTTPGLGTVVLCSRRRGSAAEVEHQVAVGVEPQGPAIQFTHRVRHGCSA